MADQVAAERLPKRTRVEHRPPSHLNSPFMTGIASGKYKPFDPLSGRFFDSVDSDTEALSANPLAVRSHLHALVSCTTQALHSRLLLTSL